MPIYKSKEYVEAVYYEGTDMVKGKKVPIFDSEPPKWLKFSFNHKSNVLNIKISSTGNSSSNGSYVVDPDTYIVNSRDYIFLCDADAFNKRYSRV